MSPTARSKAWLDEHGYIPGLVERWIPQARKRIDLWGFVDLIAMPKMGTGETKTVLVQTTSGLNNAWARARKIENHLNTKNALWCGYLIEVHAWRRLTPRGKRVTYQLRRLRASWLGAELKWIELDG